MSTADNCGHRLPRILLAVLVACGGGTERPAPTRDEVVATAQRLDEAGRTAEARAEVLRAIARQPDPVLSAQVRLYAVSLAARAGDAPALARELAAAPITEHPALAHRAAADAPVEQLAALAAVSGELARAAGDRLEQMRGPAAALAAREQAVLQLPDDADAWDAVARSRIAAGKVNDALAAWDRAAALVPAQEAFRIAPVRALAIAGLPDRAKQRTAALADDARAGGNVESLVTASAAAALVDPALALALARNAHELRPTDGRLAFLVAQRLAEVGDRAAASRAYVSLLVCGAHGRPWHRHEVAGKIRELGDVGRVALDEKPRCEPVDPDDLAQYTNALRTER